MVNFVKNLGHLCEEENTVDIAIELMKKYVQNHEPPHELTTGETCTDGAKKWAKVVVMGSIFVAAKVNECRKTNPFLLKKFREAKKFDIEISKILEFEITLLKDLNWNVHPYQFTSQRKK